MILHLFSCPSLCSGTVNTYLLLTLKIFLADCLTGPFFLNTSVSIEIPLYGGFVAEKSH